MFGADQPCSSGYGAGLPEYVCFNPLPVIQKEIHFVFFIAGGLYFFEIGFRNLSTPVICTVRNAGVCRRERYQCPEFFHSGIKRYLSAGADDGPQICKGPDAAATAAAGKGKTAHGHGA